MMKHTSGPWKHWPGRDRPLVTSKDGVVGIARAVTNNAGRDGDPGAAEAEANAHLIAAAPALLEACEEALKVINTFSTEPLPSGVYNRITRLLGDAIRHATE